MLLLTRRIGEKIIINENVTVVLKRIENGSVIIGIDAPKEIPIMREELLENGGEK